MSVYKPVEWYLSEMLRMTANGQFEIGNDEDISICTLIADNHNPKYKAQRIGVSGVGTDIFEAVLKCYIEFRENQWKPYKPVVVRQLGDKCEWGDYKVCPHCKRTLLATLENFARSNTNRPNSWCRKCKASYQSPPRPIGEIVECTTCKEQLIYNNENFRTTGRYTTYSCRKCIRERRRVDYAKRKQERFNQHFKGVVNE